MKLSSRCLGAMKDRLTQLAETAKSSKLEPKAGKPQFDDPVDTKLFEELAAGTNQRKFEHENQKEIEYTKIPSYASQNTRNLALSEPWQGTESPSDVTARTRITSKLVKEMNQKPRKVSVQDRLLSARDNSLDYKLNKDIPNKPDKDPEFSQLYRDRFLSSGGTSMSFIESIASKRIEDAYARNEFKDIPRGEKTKHDFRSSSPFIDTTEYFLNKMIQKQGAAPPWVEKQIKVNRKIENTREILLNTWISRAVKIILESVENIPKIEEKIASAANISNQLIQGDDAEQWKQENKVYHEEMIKDLNNSIRGYNLQAPGSARKHYINLEKELKDMFERSPRLIVEAVENHLVRRDPQIVPIQEDLHRGIAPKERQENHYGLREFFRGLWGKGR